MKFLNVYCDYRRDEVFINVEKIVLIRKIVNGGCEIELEGEKIGTVKVVMSAEDLVKKINGEDKMTIGFRAGR